MIGLFEARGDSAGAEPAASRAGDRRSAVPEFTDRTSITWTCWATESGSYVWRALDGRLAAWRDGKAWMASVNGRSLHPQPRLIDAMHGASMAAMSARRAAR